MSREMPSGWELLRIGDLCKPASLSVQVSDDEDYNLLGVRWYGNGCHSHSRTKGSELKTRVLNRVRASQIVYNKMWVSKGAFAVVPRDLDGAHATTEYPSFDVRLDRLDPNFIEHYMRQEAFKEDAILLCKGSTSRARLNPSDFLDMTIWLPPLSEQRRIVEILSSADESIAATRAVIEQTRKVKQGVLERLLTKGIGHTRFKETEIGEIPKGWEVKPVDELCVLSNGNGFRPPDWSDKGLPIIRIQNLNGGKNFNYFDGTPLDKWLINPGDLLFAWAGVRGVSFGPTIWPGPLGVLNQHIFKISCREDVDKPWLFQTLKLITFKIEAKAHGFKDSLLHVHKKEIIGQLVAVPPFAEQMEISTKAAELQLVEDLNQASLDRLLSLKSALMSELLTGRKRVTDALPIAAE